MALGFRYDDADAVDHPHYARYATITPGAPGRCPECDAFGYIDHADFTRHLQTQHCRACGFCWEYCFDPDGRIQEVRELTPAGGPGTTTTRVSRDADTVVDLRTAGESRPQLRGGRRTRVSPR